MKKQDKRNSQCLAAEQEIGAFIHHQNAQNLVQIAELCDQAQKYYLEGNYHASLELVMPISMADNSPLSERVKQIAVLALDDLADAYYEQGDYPNAIRCLEQWIALEPDALYPQIRKAEILWIEMDRAEEAFQIYRKVANRRPNCLEAWIGLAQIALFHGHLRRAATYLKKAWCALVAPQWAYPPTKAIVVNVLESLYALTAWLVAKMGDQQGAESILSVGMKVIGDSSEYLREALEIVHQQGSSLTE